MMQPNLEPLNPTLDEFLDRLEPMEGNEHLVVFSISQGQTSGFDMIEVAK